MALSKRTKKYLETALSDKQAAVDITKNIETSSGGAYIPLTQKGANNGVATLGATGKIPLSQIPAMATPVSSVNTQTGVVVLDSDDISEGTSNLYFTNTRAKSAAVSNSITSGVTDVAPSQDAVFNSLALKAPLASPALTGTPTAPTAAALDSSTKIATTAFVTSAISASSPSGVIKADGTVSMAANFNAGTNKIINVVNPTAAQDAATKNYVDTADSLKAPLASPALTGVPTAPTAAALTSTTQLATTAFVTSAVAAASPTGFIKADGSVSMSANLNLGTNKIVNVVNPTAAQDVATKKYVDDADLLKASITYVDSADALKSNIASPTFTGVPAAPTAAPLTNTTQLATTAFVTAAISASSPTGFIKADGTVAMAANLNLNNNKIINVVNPTAAQDVATKKYVDDADALLIPLTQKGANNGVATLGATGKIPNSQISAIAITDTFVVASQAAMLALSAAETGDIAVRTDLNKSFILQGTTFSVLSDWQELLTPTAAVASVNGQTGTVVLSTTNISEGTNLYHTTARAKSAAVSNSITSGVTDVAPSQDAVFNALALKQASGSYITALTGDVTASGPNSAAATLATVNSNVGSFGSASATATFTVNAKGLITAASSNSIAINQSQVTSLVSDLALKAPLASPALTGVPTAPTASPLTNTTQLATTAFVTSAISASSPSGVIKADGTVAMAANLNLGTNKIINVVNPTSGQDAATKKYVDDAITAIPAAPVTSVNGQTGVVSLTTSNISEGSNLYFTNTRAKTAAVSNSITSGITDVAPSQDAVFNALASKQSSGSYITALTGDMTAAGPGSAVATLATVNSNVGSFGSASSVSTITVNAKGLITAASSTSIAIAQSQVTSLVSDLALKAPLASPALTGTPTAPTASPLTNTTQLATTAFVTAAISASSPTGFIKADGTVAMTANFNAGTNKIINVVNPTLAQDAATKNYVDTADNLKAPLASPALTGIPLAPTASPLTNTTQIATTAYVDSADALKAPLTSPALTGTPTAPTATALTNSTQLATTAYVDSAVSVGSSAIDYSVMNKVLSGRDINGIFTTIEYKEIANLRKRSVLSGGISPLYTTRTVTLYAPNGITLTDTKVYTLAYDGNGDLISETL